MPPDAPHIVTVGGGFGGLYAARGLSGAHASVTLIDRRNYHLFRPMLYQVATGLLSAKAEHHLEKLGVKVHTSTRVTHVDAEGIVAAGQRVLASTVLWSAGVRASPAGRWLGAATDRSGRVIVNSDLSIPGHPEIFAIGDTAHVVAPSSNLLGIHEKGPMVMPGVAQPAIQASLR